LAQLRAVSAPIVGRRGRTQMELSAGLLNGLTRIETFSDDAYSNLSGSESGDERVYSFRGMLTHRSDSSFELRSAVTINEIRYAERLDATPARYAQRLWSAGLEAQQTLGDRSLLT